MGRSIASSATGPSIRPAARIALQQIAYRENAHRRQQELQHLPKRYSLAQLSYDRQRWNHQADQLEKASELEHVEHVTTRGQAGQEAALA